MKGIDFIDYLRKERRLTEYQIGKVISEFLRQEKEESHNVLIP